MVQVKILGSGCVNCKRVESVVRKIIAAQGVKAEIEKVTEYAEIMRYPILGTPGLVINGKLMAAGRIPPEADIANWLRQASAQA